MPQRALIDEPVAARAVRQFPAVRPGLAHGDVDEIFMLQRSAGNAAVARLLGRRLGRATPAQRLPSDRLRVDAALTTRLDRCGKGTCSCEACSPREEIEEAMESGASVRKRPRVVLARAPAYRAGPPWATRDPTQSEDACMVLPEWLAQVKWPIWSTAFTEEAVDRCGCSEVRPVWQAYFSATGSPRFKWEEARQPTSCIITSLKSDDDHVPYEDAIMAKAKTRMPSVLGRLKGHATVRVPLSDLGITGTFAKPDLTFNHNTRVGGQLFGGVGESEYGPDTRKVDGFVELTKQVDPTNRLWISVLPRFELNWHLTDGVDFCPGNTGEHAHWTVHRALLNVSALEASGMARDIDIEAHYTRVRYDVPWGPFANPDLIDPNPIITIPSQALFDYNSDTLRPEAEQALLRTLGTRPSRADLSHPVEVHGHTDSKGSPAFNQRLSERRAAAVKRLLEDNYPNLVGHIAAEGHGEDQPIAPNEIQGADNPSGRALNRRVEIRLSARFSAE